jgi:hypothetical protein
MKLSNALARIQGGTPTVEKTAGVVLTATTPSSSDAAKDTLQAALKEATAPDLVATKTASQTSPVEDLAKLAADVSATEGQAITKEAQMYGAAVADGFVARLAQYQEASSKLAAQGVVPAPVMTPKLASLGNDGSFEKFAAENPDLVREAHDIGYESTKAELTKLAEAAYVRAYNGTVEGIYKLASDTFVAGFSETIKLIEASAR